MTSRIWSWVMNPSSRPRAMRSTTAADVAPSLAPPLDRDAVAFFAAVRFVGTAFRALVLGARAFGVPAFGAPAFGVPAFAAAGFEAAALVGAFAEVADATFGFALAAAAGGAFVLPGAETLALVAAAAFAGAAFVIFVSFVAAGFAAGRLVVVVVATGYFLLWPANTAAGLIACSSCSRSPTSAWNCRSSSLMSLLSLSLSPSSRTPTLMSAWRSASR